jgi:RimJ/RimL family protein N-acetyltransferase
VNENDVDQSYDFFNQLSEQDRLYLRIDVSRKGAVQRRLMDERWDREVCYRLVAEKEGRIIADATLCRPSFGWSTHTANLRYIVLGEFRRKGLATILVRELFVTAVKEGIEKIEAEIMEENNAAIKSVEKLGFKQEGVLKDFVTDIKGSRHNLVIMSYAV